MGNLGFQELLIIGVVILVMFGGRKIPEFMRGLGKGIREFNDAKNNVKKENQQKLSWLFVFFFNAFFDFFFHIVFSIVKLTDTLT